MPKHKGLPGMLGTWGYNAILVVLIRGWDVCEQLLNGNPVKYTRKSFYRPRVLGAKKS